MPERPGNSAVEKIDPDYGQSILEKEKTYQLRWVLVKK
jgi:hypothetical protein